MEVLLGDSTVCSPQAEFFPPQLCVYVNPIKKDNFLFNIHLIKTTVSTHNPGSAPQLVSILNMALCCKDHRHTGAAPRHTLGMMGNG